VSEIAESPISRFLEHEAFVILAFAADGLLLIVLFMWAYGLFMRWEERPHALERQTEEEFEDVGERLTLLEEESAGHAEAAQTLEERLAFLESLLTGPAEAPKGELAARVTAPPGDKEK
jgi:hypothetical protein